MLKGPAGEPVRLAYLDVRRRQPIWQNLLARMAYIIFLVNVNYVGRNVIPEQRS
jgi:hypothetical protein